MLWMTKRIPTAPAGFDKDRFFDGIMWHQKWQLYKDVYTPGVNPIEDMCEDLQLPKNLSGRRVLDIGAWNGCLSFECERRGAREVVALSPEDPDWSGFNKLHGALDSKRVRYVRGTVYDLNPRKLGYFDVVLFCGVLYHLRYPILGIDNIRRVCKGDVYVETVVSDAQLIVPEGNEFQKIPMENISPKLLAAPLWQFYRFSELNGDPSNWFGPNCVAVVQAFESAGFETRVLKNLGRATFHGRLKAGPPEFLTIGTTEGVYYDHVTSHLMGSENLAEVEPVAASALASFSENLLTDLLASKEYCQKNGKNDQAWIASLYQHLLGNAAAASKELPLRKIYSDEVSYRRAIVSTILTSTDYRARLIAGYYTTYLNRQADKSEINHWLKVMKHGNTPEALQAEFLGSDEYFGTHGGTNRTWLEHVCQLLLGKPTDADFDGYLDALDDKAASRAQVVSALLDTLEHRRRLIQSQCTTYLGRSSSPEEAQTWANRPRRAVA